MNEIRIIYFLFVRHMVLTRPQDSQLNWVSELSVMKPCENTLFSGPSPVAVLTCSAVKPPAKKGLFFFFFTLSLHMRCLRWDQNSLSCGLVWSCVLFCRSVRLCLHVKRMCSPETEFQHTCTLSLVDILSYWPNKIILPEQKIKTTIQTDIAAHLYFCLR